MICAAALSLGLLSVTVEPVVAAPATSRATSAADRYLARQSDGTYKITGTADQTGLTVEQYSYAVKGIAAMNEQILAGNLAVDANNMPHLTEKGEKALKAESANTVNPMITDSEGQTILNHTEAESWRIYFDALGWGLLTIGAIAAWLSTRWDMSWLRAFARASIIYGMTAQGFARLIEVTDRGRGIVITWRPFSIRAR